MLPFLGRSVRQKRARSHRNTVSSQRLDMSSLSSLFIKRYIWLLCGPDVVEKHCAFTSKGNNGLVLSLLAATSCQM
jgi:hypothetical protein